MSRTKEMVNPVLSTCTTSLLLGTASGDSSRCRCCSSAALCPLLRNRTRRRGQGAESREQRDESREQRAESREQRAESRDERAERRESAGVTHLLHSFGPTGNGRLAGGLSYLTMARITSDSSLHGLSSQTMAQITSDSSFHGLSS